MTEQSKLKSSETVYRGLVRLPGELETRRPKDENDFVRRKNYGNSGKPENGLSVFRKRKFSSLQGLWDRMRMRSPLGVSECAIGKLEKKGLKFVLGGDEAEHVSIRCPDCNMKELPDICKPKGSKDHWDCPFFDIDTFDLEQAFDLVEKPKVRTLTPKKKGK